MLARLILCGKRFLAAAAMAAIFALAPAASSADQATYTFQNITPDGLHQAHRSQVLEMFFPYTQASDQIGFTEATRDEYEAISITDDLEWVSPDPGNADTVFFQFDMTITSPTECITQMEFTWQGYAEGNQPAPFQIWVHKRGLSDDIFTPANWVHLAPEQYPLGTGPEDEIEFTRSIPGNYPSFTDFSEFIDADTHTIRWGVYGFRINNSANKQMHVNKAEVRVTTGGTYNFDPGGVIAFGLTPIGGVSDPPVQVRVTNTTDTALVIDSFGLAGIDADQFVFMADTGETTLTKNQSRTAEVAFAPNSNPAAGIGVKDALVRVSTNNPKLPIRTIILTGTGGGGELTPDQMTIDFGDWNVIDGPTDPPRAVNLENTGIAPTNISSISIIGDDAAEFMIVTDPLPLGPLAPGVSINLGLVFDPDSIGPKMATLRIVSDVYPIGVLDIILIGNGSQLCDTLSTSMLDFGDWDINAGPSLIQTATLRVCNQASIENITITGADANQFSLQSFYNYPVALAPNDYITADVNFNPSSLGMKTAVLSFVSIDLPTTFTTVTLKGNGAVPSPTPSPSPSPSATPTPQLLINEVDADDLGPDDAEIIEIFDGGFGGISMNGRVLVVFDGATDLSIIALDMDGYVTNGSGYVLLGGSGISGADVPLANDSLPNGPAAVALYAANGTDFPNGTPVTTANLIDAIVYNVTAGGDVGLQPLLLAGQPVVNEAGGGDVQAHSNQRCPNGSGGLRRTLTYLQRVPSPGGMENDCPTPTPSRTPSPSASPSRSPSRTASPTSPFSPTPSPTPNPPVFAIHPQPQSANVGQNIAFNALATGEGAITYQWIKDSSDLTGQTGTALSVPGVTTASQGGYQCRATNVGGSTLSAVATLAVFDPRVANNAAFVSDTIPATMFVGQDLYVGIVMRNNSQLTWSAPQNYALGAFSDPSNLFAGETRFPLPDPLAVIPTGGTGFVNFVALIQAPAAPGLYTAQLRMVEEFVEFFGETVNVSINVIVKPNSAEEWEAYE